MTRLALLAIAVAGCGPAFAVVPRGGLSQSSAVAPMGITLTAFADQWSGDPRDLADYVTPVLVELTNNGPYEVRVSYGDFALTDQFGTRYQAINPFVNGLTLNELVDGGYALARWSGGGFRGGGGIRVRTVGPRGGGVVIRAPGAHLGVRGRFHFAPGLHRWYGGHVGYWGRPLFVPPWYATWVVYWSPAIAGIPLSDALVDAALPEGVLPPGGTVSGFLYFRRATAPGRQLDLAWQMYQATGPETAGAALGSTHIPLDVLPL